MLPATRSGTLWRITLAMHGSSPPSDSPIRKRSTTSCQPAVTKACGISSSADTARQPTITFQCPTRSASLPSREAERMLPSAAADITRPAIIVTRCGSSSSVAT
ncbi:hypothetical protein D3C87_1109100 [compost metagenome]